MLPDRLNKQMTWKCVCFSSLHVNKKNTHELICKYKNCELIVIYIGKRVVLGVKNTKTKIKCHLTSIIEGQRIHTIFFWTNILFDIKMSKRHWEELNFSLKFPIWSDEDDFKIKSKIEQLCLEYRLTSLTWMFVIFYTDRIENKIELAHTIHVFTLRGSWKTVNPETNMTFFSGRLYYTASCHISVFGRKGLHNVNNKLEAENWSFSLVEQIQTALKGSERSIFGHWRISQAFQL